MDFVTGMKKWAAICAAQESCDFCPLECCCSHCPPYEYGEKADEISALIRSNSDAASASAGGAEFAKVLKRWSAICDAHTYGGCKSCPLHGYCKNYVPTEWEPKSIENTILSNFGRMVWHF